jgi:RHH-type proline utilization regulon transcriptional repressor/proline dehydrogenase/delta 1-pyrroline-5-carboxylate dehydrogenase
VIAPWNFPLAILCGMTVAPLLAGNPVIMKPAEQASGIAKVLYDMMLEVGFPRDVVQFLPGRGEDVGAHLVSHADIHIINFTGSRTVGLKILEEASRVRPGQRHIKKVVAEMGGKNSMIVDDDADMDEAVLASLRAAFHFQGQKCSALSRLIVLESNYERFRDRLVQALKSMTLGSVLDPATRVGAVIDREAQERLLKTIERNKSKIIAQVEVSASLMEKGNYVPATLFEDNDFASELSQQEHFGPLLAIYRVKSLDEAIERLNDTDYALTGGIFSRSPKNIRQFIEQAEVGNAYINRGVTGSIVSRQPFGGFKLSGVGAKAGGPDYLLQFLEPRTFTENLMRRGFTPEL